MDYIPLMRPERSSPEAAKIRQCDESDNEPLQKRGPHLVNLMAFFVFGTSG